jgi:hypothetical protein
MDIKEGRFMSGTNNKKVNKVFCVFLISSLLGIHAPVRAEWQKPLQPSLSGGPLTCLAVHPLDPAKFLLASERNIFEGGRENSWKELWSHTEPGAGIKKIFSFSALPRTVFALANNSVFVGSLQDLSWQKIYEHSDRRPLSFLVDPQNANRWLLGTQKGLWETSDAGKSWARSSVFLPSVPVTVLFSEDTRSFVATENALYLSLTGRPAERVFSLPAGEQDVLEDQSDNADAGNPIYFSKIHDLIASKHPSPALFLATRNGVFQSLDRGYRWAALPKSGLQNPEVFQLAYADCLYAATPRGAYKYDALKSKWSELFDGLAQNDVRGIAVLNHEKLLAITKEGFVESPLVFPGPEARPVLRIFRPDEKMLVLLKELFSLEPTAREIQEQIIRYANVSNGKVKRWHAASRIASLLPSLSLGKTMYRNASISTYSGKFITGPEDVNKTYDTDLRWNLGDMLYNSNQTSIDSREKLMVELRNDLLSEATRIYYERRRLQIGLVFSLPGSEQEFLEKLVRLDELTTLLDGMTDGFFSNRLERLYAERPELSGLWKFNRTDDAWDSGLAPRDSKLNEKPTT